MQATVGDKEAHAATLHDLLSPLLSTCAHAHNEGTA